jgi:predicted ribosomally synthesized peptide with nif11-like leader
MSEEQLSALLAKLQDDEGLQEKLKSAADLDAAVANAKAAGYEMSKAEWLKAQASQKTEMSDEELAGVTGGSRGSLEGLKEGFLMWLMTGGGLMIILLIDFKNLGLSVLRKVLISLTTAHLQCLCHHRGFCFFNCSRQDQVGIRYLYKLPSP